MKSSPGDGSRKPTVVAALIDEAATAKVEVEAA